MYGHFRPKWKSRFDILRKPYSSCYCTLCKSLKKQYFVPGVMSLSYEMTLVSILYMALTDEESITGYSFCSLTPCRIVKTIDCDNIIWEKFSTLSIIVLYFKFCDNLSDNGTELRLGFLNNTVEKARNRLPEFYESFSSLSDMIYISENTDTDMRDMIALNSCIVSDIFRFAFEEFREKSFYPDLMQLGALLGSWLYVIDAVKDYHRDAKTNNYNIFANMPYDQAVTMADRLLDSYVGDIRKLAQELPFKRYSDTIKRILETSLTCLHKKGTRFR